MSNFENHLLKTLVTEALLNAYRVLGVGPGASDEEIRSAWRKLAMANHPDRGGSNARMININVAKDRLLNKLELQRLGPDFKSDMPRSTDVWRSTRPLDRQAADVKRRRAPKADQPTGPESPMAGVVGDDVKQKDQLYKVYGKKQGPRTVRVKTKLYGTSEDGMTAAGVPTKFKPSDRVAVAQDGSKMRVSDTTSGHSQVWDPIDETTCLIDKLIVEYLSKAL